MRKKTRTIAAILITLTAIVFIACSKPEEPDNNDDIVQNDSIATDSVVVDSVILEHAFVDLGLPSGTLWATCNLGAETPEDCGDYFAWGETAPKEMYDWKQYKYSTYDIDRYRLTKYCTNSEYGFNGFVDSLTVLEPMDDAVMANWGDNWRMPTADEWRELLQYTTDTMTVQNGVSGRLFTGSNGNSLFLPNTGFYLDDEVLCLNLGIYWSSTLQTTFQIVAWSYHSDSDECHVCGTYERSRGHCVRAVHPAK